MQTKIVQIENLEAVDLITRLDRMESAINALTENPQTTSPATSTEYVTRREVAKLFKISLVTVHAWTKKGILHAYKIGNKVFYKRLEVESALIKKGGLHGK